MSKRVASEFVDKRAFDRIGLAVFSGEAFTQCPLTTDHRIVKEFLANLKVWDSGRWNGYRYGLSYRSKPPER